MLLRAYAETSSEKVRQSAAELRTKFVVSHLQGVHDEHKGGPPSQNPNWTDVLFILREFQFVIKGYIQNLA